MVGKGWRVQHLPSGITYVLTAPPASSTLSHQPSTNSFSKSSRQFTTPPAISLVRHYRYFLEFSASRRREADIGRL
jgi:hypothetical protein